MELNEIKDKFGKSFADRFATEQDYDAFCQTVLDHIMNVDGYINLDIDDVICTLERADVAETGTMTGGQDEIYDMLNSMHTSMQQAHPGLQQSTLLMQLQFDRASGLPIEKLNYLTKFVVSLSEDVDVIWGVGLDDTLGTDVRITIIEGYKSVI